MTSQENKILKINAPVQIPLRQKCKKIFAGQSHSYAIAENDLYFWGQKHACYMEHDNQLFRHNKSDLSEYMSCERLVKMPIKVEQLSTGSTHTFAWNSKEVYCWGSNENYELGLEQQKDYGCQKVELFEKASEQGYDLQTITCGEHHTLAIFSRPNQVQSVDHSKPMDIDVYQDQDEGEHSQAHLFAWGQSASYQLTINTLNIIPYPVLSPCTFHQLQKVYSKNDYNIAICNGKVYSWGSNLFSRLGFVDAKSKLDKIRIPKHVDLPNTIQKIGIGNNHVVAVAINGEAFSWGLGKMGQLGINRFEPQSKPTKVICDEAIVDAYCGDSHTIVLLSDGRLKSCGNNHFGALGHSIFQTSNKLKRCKKLEDVENQQIFGDVCMVACGSHHNLVLNKEGRIFGWGSNDLYQVLPLNNQTEDLRQVRLNKNIKKSLEIRVDNAQQSCERMTQQEKDSEHFLTLLCDWKKRFEQFRQSKRREEEILMKELEEITKLKSKS